MSVRGMVLFAAGGLAGALLVLGVTGTGLRLVTSGAPSWEGSVERAKLFPAGSCSSDDWRTAWPARDGTHCVAEDRGLSRSPPVDRWDLPPP